MRLLLDLGNTRLKWVLQQHGQWLQQGALDWHGEVAGALQAVAKPAAGLQIWASSVVDRERERQVEQWLAPAGPVHWLRTPAAGCGVRNGYADPGRLGVDRFLAMVAAHAQGASPCVLVGVGTALTLDALDAEGLHLGGLIAPGPQLMQRSVLGATAGVRPQGQGRLTDAADNTADGLYAGCWHATAALVERFVGRLSPRLGRSPRVLLGGGDAAALQPLLEVPSELVTDAVLHGLSLWADAQVERPRGD